MKKIIQLVLVSFIFMSVFVHPIKADDCGCSQNTNTIDLTFIDDLLNENKTDEAINSLNLIIQTNEGEIIVCAQYKLGYIWSEYKKNYPKALENFSEVIAQETSQEFATNQSVQLLIKKSFRESAYIYQWYLKDYQQAINFYNKAVVLSVSTNEIVENKYNIAWCYVGLKDLRTAAESFKEVGTTFNGSWAARSLYEAGNNYIKLKDYVKAKEMYLKLITDYPDDSRISAVRSRLNWIDLNYLEE